MGGEITTIPTKAGIGEIIKYTFMEYFFDLTKNYLAELFCSGKYEFNCTVLITIPYCYRHHEALLAQLD